MNIGHITGGTNAGWRRVKQAHKPWLCECNEAMPEREPNPGYLSKCSCGNPRPN